MGGRLLSGRERPPFSRLFARQNAVRRYGVAPGHFDLCRLLSVAVSLKHSCRCFRNVDPRLLLTSCSIYSSLRTFFSRTVHFSFCRQISLRERFSDYQTGSLNLEERKKGFAIWVYRWWEKDINGKSIRRKLQVGDVGQYTTESAAQSAADALRLTINNRSQRSNLQRTTVKTLWEHYISEELP